MKASSKCIELIKQFEGCKLEAYYDAVGILTIGYGHTGTDVKKGMKISHSQAVDLLILDLEKFEKKVDKYNSIYNFNQNQFDSLTSFAYNIGSIAALTNYGKRTIAQISAKIPAYNKAGGKVLNGLVRRRAAEKALFDTPVATKTNCYAAYKGSSTSLVIALKSVGETNTSYSHRKVIASANAIGGYTGTAAQNTKMLNLLKAGKLVKA